MVRIKADEASTRYWTMRRDLARRPMNAIGGEVLRIGPKKAANQTFTYTLLVQERITRPAVFGKTRRSAYMRLILATD